VRSPRPSERGAADASALGLALLLAVAAVVPTALLRAGQGWRKCREEALRLEERPPADGASTIGKALSAAAAARGALARSRFVPDPSRRLGPVPVAEAAPAPLAAARVTDLSGRVTEGRLTIRWTPARGSTGTSLRIEGLGGPEALEREVPAGTNALDLAVPGTSGTVVIRASAVGSPNVGPEARVSIPYRIPVEVAGAERPSDDSGSAIVRLRRAYDGKVVEAEFALHEEDPVGDLSSVHPGGPVVDFRTNLVLEEVRILRAAGPFIEAPLFGPEGRTLRDGEGRPMTYGRASTVCTGHEVVLRGPDDERTVLRVR
jgi:hypothetical protein